MFSADHGEFAAGKSSDKVHPISIRFDGAELLPEKSVTETFGNARAGHNNERFNADNEFFMTYRVLIFRATQSSGMLTLSDWASDTDPGGPIGQELMHNFIELQPYSAD